MHIQLDFFTPVTPVTMLAEGQRMQQKSINNLRKGLFQRHGELQKELARSKTEIDDLRLEIAQMKKNIRMIA